ncbi:MAG: Uncharacterised protein [Euryarchaeota archaeon UBA443]|nr:MAG: Uncharacterised protein [Euryarchaeota archaeon UBA443]
MTDRRLNVGEGNVAEREVSNVAVGVARSCTTRTVSTVCVVITVAGASGDCCRARVVEINIIEDVSVISSTSTVVCEGNTLPLSATCALEDDTFASATACSNGVTSTVDRDTLALFNLDGGSFLNGKVATADGQVVAIRADSVW